MSSIQTVVKSLNWRGLTLPTFGYAGMPGHFCASGVVGAISAVEVTFAQRDKSTTNPFNHTVSGSHAWSQCSG